MKIVIEAAGRTIDTKQVIIDFKYENGVGEILDFKGLLDKDYRNDDLMIRLVHTGLMLKAYYLEYLSTGSTPIGIGNHQNKYVFIRFNITPNSFGMLEKRGINLFTSSGVVAFIIKNASIEFSNYLINFDCVNKEKKDAVNTAGLFLKNSYFDGVDTGLFEFVEGNIKTD